MIIKAMRLYEPIQGDRIKQPKNKTWDRLRIDREGEDSICLRALGEDELSCSGLYTFMKGYNYSFGLEKTAEARDVSWRSNIYETSSDHFQPIALKPFFPTQNSPEL